MPVIVPDAVSDPVVSIPAVSVPVAVIVPAVTVPGTSRSVGAKLATSSVVEVNSPPQSNVDFGIVLAIPTLLFATSIVNVPGLAKLASSLALLIALLFLVIYQPNTSRLNEALILSESVCFVAT